MGDAVKGPTSVRRRAEFRDLVQRLVAECDAHGIHLPQEAAEDLLADRVAGMAKAMRVREDTIVRSYLSTIDPAELVAAFRLARDQSERELAATSPTVLDLCSVGRLVASLGQAVRCVSLNHADLAGSEYDKWEAIGVLDTASNALTLLGVAMEAVDNTAGRVSVLLSDETVTHTRRALIHIVTNLTSGTWSFGHGAALDTEVAARMNADLALLPPG